MEKPSFLTPRAVRNMFSYGKYRDYDICRKNLNNTYYFSSDLSSDHFENFSSFSIIPKAAYFFAVFGFCAIMISPQSLWVLHTCTSVNGIPAKTY